MDSSKIYIIDGNTVLGKGSVEVIDSQGRIIKGDKVIYEKTKEIVIVDGNVEVFDKKGNILRSDKATYDKINELINTFEIICQTNIKPIRGN